MTVRLLRAALIAAALSQLVSLSARATTTDATPELRNSPKLTTPERVKTDPFNGTAAYAYKIDVPPGTAGMTPSLVLTYSTQTQHSEYGYGWSLNLPYIERSTREHRPYYNDPASPSPLDDEFELAGDLLVREGTSNRFHLRYADGSRILWDGTNQRWEVTRPDGTRQLFGSTQYSTIYRSDGGSDPAEVFRWSLSEVIDARGNSYRIFYECDADVAGTGSSVVIDYCTYVYPLKITYTHSLQGSGSLQAHRAIELDWVERANPGESNTANGVCDGSEDCPTSYRAGFQVQRRKRLARIGVGIDTTTDGLELTEEVRSYAFSYSNKLFDQDHSAPPFSQLASIQRNGKNGEPFPSATEFTYTHPERGFEAHPPGEEGGPWASTPGRIVGGASNFLFGIWWSKRLTLDMTGDGIADRIEIVGTDAQHEWLVYPGRIVQGLEGPEPGGFDLDNPIHWKFDCGGPSPSAMCQAAESKYLQHNPYGYGLLTEITDMDGDLLPDRVVAVPGTVKQFLVYRNLGAAQGRFGPAEQWTPDFIGLPSAYVTQSPLAAGSTWPSVYRFPADINGDGRPEYFADNQVVVNTGSGFGAAKFAFMDNYSVVTFNDTSDPQGGKISQLFDVNGDGIPDYVPHTVCTDRTTWLQFGLGYGAGDASWRRPLTGVGHEWAPPHEVCPPQWVEGRYDRNMYASMIDMNGDGIRDWVRSDQGADWEVWFGVGDGRLIGPVAWGMSAVFDYGPCQEGATNYQFDIAVTWGAGAIARTIDLDGDGLVDYVRTRSPDSTDIVDSPICTGLPHNWAVFRHPGPEGLLETVINELGGVTTIQYTPSTWLKQLQEEPEAGGLPSDVIPDGRPRWVVTHVEVSDGRTGTAKESESLDYAGFRFDQVRRETFGVRMAENQDAAGLVTRSLFHQHPEKRGKLERLEKCRGSACLETVETEWEVIDEPVPDASFLVRPTKTTTTTRTCDPEQPSGCTPSPGAQVHIVEREFDEETGLLERETDYGPDANLAASGDNLVRVLSYAKNTAEWIVSTVFEDSLYFGTEGSSNLASRTRLYYDAAASGGGTPSTPQRCTSGGGSCGALVTFRETLRDRSTAEIWATEKWTYDGVGNMTAYFDPKALAVGGAATQTVVYDTSEYNTFPISIANALQHTSQFRFDAGLGEVERALTPGGHLRCFTHDDFGRLAERSEYPISMSSIPEAGCAQVLASFEFHDLGDPESQRIEETLHSGTAAGPIESLRYFDGLGREYQNETRHRHSPPSFDVSSRAWGTRGELTCETLPFRRPGNTSSITPCSGQEPRRETSYDELLRPVMIERVEPGGGRIAEVLSEYEINGFGLTSSVGDLFVEQRTTIGGGGGAGQNPTPDRIQLFGLDNQGQVVVLRDGTDPAATTTLKRDPKGRITRVDGPDVSILSGGVDPNLLEIAYNAVDQRTEVSQPISPGDGAAPKWRFSYDLNGDLYEQTSPRGEKLRLHYDALRRLALKDYGPSYSSSAATPGGGDIVHEYHASYEGIGQLASVYGRYGIRTDLDYDYRGRVLNKTRDFWGSMQFSFGYDYDLLDRPAYDYLPDQSGIAYLYDGSQLTTIGGLIATGGGTVNDILVTEVDAHPSGGLTGFRTFPLALGQQFLESSYAYHPADHRLWSATTYKDGEAIQDITYSYDTAGNLRQSDDALGELDQEFSYDPLHRLAEVATLGTHGYGTHRYTYDLAGNIRSKGPAGAPGELNLRYDRTPGQPTHIAAVDLFAAGSWLQNAGLYTADADGGITSRTHFGLFTTSFSRNADGRIQGVGLPVPNESLVNHYDHTGERSEKLHLGIYASVIADRYYVDPGFEVDTVNNTHEVHFFLGGRRVATSLRTGLGNGTPTSVTQVTTYHPDQVGTNTVTTTSTATSQTVSKSFLDPFGAKQSGTGTEPRHLFTDQERDSETGLDYFHARFYDPWVGRFLEQDPSLMGSDEGLAFGRIAGDAGNLNPYAYVLNRPTALVDPTGRDWVDWSMGNTIITFGSGGGNASGSGASDVAGGGSASTGTQATGSSSGASSGADGAPEGIETITVTGTPVEDFEGSVPGFQTAEWFVWGCIVTWHFPQAPSAAPPGATGWDAIEGWSYQDGMAFDPLNWLSGPTGRGARLGMQAAKPSISAIKRALTKVHGKVGRLPKGEKGKFGSPQRGTSKKGYRLDPPHPGATPGDAESSYHINWWDYTKGKRSGGAPGERSGAVPIGDD